MRTVFLLAWGLRACIALAQEAPEPTRGTEVFSGSGDVSQPHEKPDKPVTMTDKITTLEDLGLAPAEIARILSKPVNYVTGALSARKRRAKAGQDG